MSLDNRNVKEVLFAQLGRIKTIADLAELVVTPPEALRKASARHERKSLSRYINEVRIERAKKLLLKSNESCKAICYAIGYSRADTGARAFKRHTGFSMEKFRKSARDIGKRHVS